MKLLKYALDVTVNIEKIKFPCANLHGNLKLLMLIPVNGRTVLRFSCRQDSGA